MMKEYITKNLGLKLLSLLIAFVLWLAIINMTDPIASKTFYDIPVEILNENAITSSNQIFEIVSGEVVDVTIKGKRSFIEGLDASDFYACADLSKLSTVNTAGINVELKKASKENVELDWNNEVLCISLEERGVQQFRVKIITEGDLAENFVLGDVTTTPNMVEVSGPKSKIKKIDSIGALVDISGQSDNFTKQVTPILYDKDGEIMDSSNVVFGKETIKVHVQVLPTKSVPLYVDVKGTPAEGYHHIQTDFRPESVLVAGKRDQLDKIKSITIPVNVDRAKADVEEEVDLTYYLNSQYRIADDYSTVSIRCVIEKNGKRTYELTKADIALKNLAESMNFSYVDEDLRYKIIVTGDEEQLRKLTLSNLNAYIDVANLGVGQHSVEVHFDLPDDLKLKKKTKVDIRLSQADAATLSTPQPTEEPD